MAFDTKAWMKSVGFTDEWIAQHSSEFDGVAEGIEKTVLMRSDHSRELDKLRTATADLEKRDAKLTADMAEWAEMSSAEKAANGDLKTKIDDAQARIYTLTQKVTRLAEEAGVDPKTVLDEGDVKPPEKKEPAPYDPTPLQTQMGRVAEYMITLAGELPAIQAEHLRLTGEALDTRAFTAAIKADIASGKATQDSLDPVKRWESQFGIAEKRKAADLKAREDEIKAARAEERTLVLSEAALPGGSTLRAGTHSPAFKTTNVAAGSKLQRPQPGQRLAGAVAALTSGKYRNGGKSGTA